MNISPGNWIWWRCVLFSSKTLKSFRLCFDAEKTRHSYHCQAHSIRLYTVLEPDISMLAQYLTRYDLSSRWVVKRPFYYYNLSQNQAGFGIYLYVTSFWVGRRIPSARHADATFNDILRMVYQERPHRVIMVTTLIEDARRECEQLWPDVGTRLYMTVQSWRSITQTSSPDPSISARWPNMMSMCEILWNDDGTD